jgi:predicted  nucleic acid-binding Zn-ribbon protein
MEIPGIGSDAIHELKDDLVHWLDRYEEKLNEAEELLYRTAAAISQADQTLADDMTEFGLELHEQFLSLFDDCMNPKSQYIRM